MADAKIVQLTDAQGNELAPQTLASWVFKQDGQLLEGLILPKDNIEPYTPTGDYNPATKGYVDGKQKIQIITSIQQPKNMNVGDIWYQEISEPYTFSEVDGLGYTFADVDALNITLGDVDFGGW